ncbi:hypothetical protein J7E62_07550 [Variovorax paradoxus]|nr:hypothetical protein [Variovorax paradoxus]
MKRVTREGGTVAVVVNNFRCGWTPFSFVWDAAAVLDAHGAAMGDEMVSKSLGWPGGLADLFKAAELADIVEEQLSVLFEYRPFEDYWATFLTGQGKTGSYVTQLAELKRDELVHHVRTAYLCGLPDGPRALTTSFWAVRGAVLR